MLLSSEKKLALKHHFAQVNKSCFFVSICEMDNRGQPPLSIAPHFRPGSAFFLALDLRGCELLISVGLVITLKLSAASVLFLSFLVLPQERLQMKEIPN